MITTHVLDTGRGQPARGLLLALDRLNAVDWTPVSSGVTDDDGRCAQLTLGVEIGGGTYRIRFETGAYFAAQQVDTFYPFVEVTFVVGDPGAHLHVPLLLSPFAYSTYRGS